MASTPEGRRLTEQHRQDQHRLKAEFLSKFVELWPTLNPYDLDRTTSAWLFAVEPLIAEYREESARITEDYYVAFRAAEAPQAALDGPPPVITREQPSRLKSPRRRTAPRTSSGRRLVKPKLVWADDDDAARTGLLVTGPANVKSKVKRGDSPEKAARDAVVDAGGSAARHVLTGGRAQHLEMIHADPATPIGWIRVTDGDPCAFCAMLASRGPRYRSQATATQVQKGRRRQVGEEYHDNCGCTAEAVWSKSQAWPGRGREFQKLWYDTTKGLDAADARRAFRRAYEYEQRKRNRYAA